MKALHSYTRFLQMQIEFRKRGKVNFEKEEIEEKAMVSKGRAEELEKLLCVRQKEERKKEAEL